MTELAKPEEHDDIREDISTRAAGGREGSSIGIVAAVLTGAHKGTTKPIGSGAGLGLSACYGIIQEHGGEISCGNREEGGAVFTVRLPIAAERVQAAAANLPG